MAIRGISLAERQEYILRDDPAHPENIKAEIEKRTKDAKSDAAKEKIIETIEKEAGKPTVFLIGNLLQEDRVFLGDLGAGLEQTPQGNMRMLMRNTDKAYETVRRGLKGCENFLDADGKKIPFETQPGMGERNQPRTFVSDGFISRIPNDVLREVAAEILRVNGVTSELEKKFADALQQSAEDHSAGGLAELAANETS